MWLKAVRRRNLGANTVHGLYFSAYRRSHELDRDGVSGVEPLPGACEAGAARWWARLRKDTIYGRIIWRDKP